MSTTVSQLMIDGMQYRITLQRGAAQSPAAPRLLIVSFLPNARAVAILKTCLKSLHTFTAEPHEIWVIDNGSRAAYRDWLLDWPDIHVVLNHTPPLPPEGRGLLARFQKKKWRWRVASYQNAVALEIALRLIDPATEFIVPMHQDTMPTAAHWLSYLKGKIDDHIRAAGMLMERGRVKEGVLHVQTMLVAFQLFRSLKLDFFPKLPDYDVGDAITLRLREAGYGVFSCANSKEDAALISRVPKDSPCYSFNQHTTMDRAFDDAGELIHLHFGRGVLKAKGEYHKSNYITPEAWCELGERLAEGKP